MTLKAFRVESRIRLVELAKESKISPSKLSMIENRWIRLSKHDADKIEAAYRQLGFDARKAVQKSLSQSGDSR